MDSINPRHLLLEQMMQLATEGKTCASCSGVCCTFVANSMMVTPDEAKTLVGNLRKKNLLTDELKKSCQETITRFSLDRPIPGTGNRNLLRRRYTCPLFRHQSLGCPLDAEAKPFGCLAFNPTVESETKGDQCRSDTQLLERTEQLVQTFERSGSEPVEKLSIPQAILALW